MPRLTRFFLKIALLHLFLSLLLYTLGSYPVASGWVGVFGQLTPTVYHLFMVGFVTQTIMGVAYWMFPRKQGLKEKVSDPLGWVTWVLLNVGLLLRLIGEPWSTTPSTAKAWLLGASAILQVIAGFIFVINIWTRVRGR